MRLRERNQSIASMLPISGCGVVGGTRGKRVPIATSGAKAITSRLSSRFVHASPTYEAIEDIFFGIPPRLAYPAKYLSGPSKQRFHLMTMRDTMHLVMYMTDPKGQMKAITVRLSAESNAPRP